MDSPELLCRSPLHCVNTRMVLFSRWFINAISFASADLLAIAMAFYLAGVLRTNILGGGRMLPEWGWLISGLWVFLSFGFKLTPGWGLGVVDATRKMFLLLTTIFAGTTSALFLTKQTDNTSRFTLTAAFVLCVFFLPIGRWFIKKLLIHHDLWGMLVVVYSTTEKAGELLQVLAEGAGMGYVPTGLFLVDAPEGRTGLHGVPILSHELDPYPLAHAAILVEPETLKDHRPDFTEIASIQYRRVLIVPQLSDQAPSLWVTNRDLGGVLGMEISSNLLDRWSRLLKQASEVLIVLVFLPLVIPLILLLTLAIFLWDFRNPFFIQTRIGQNGVPFRMFKFRTMHPDAEELLQKRLSSDAGFRAAWEDGCKVKDDPRITGIGRFLRSTSLDELPQFINVLLGQMALIGPRPLPDYHERELPERIIDLRRRVRPGMTGLWQVSGRSDQGNEGFVRWDAYYVRNWSVWLDIVILVRTFFHLIHRKGAY